MPRRPSRILDLRRRPGRGNLQACKVENGGKTGLGGGRASLRVAQPCGGLARPRAGSPRCGQRRTIKRSRSSPALSLIVTCAQCREDVLEADRIDDEEECTLRDHLMLLHPNTLQPETRGVLLRHFILKELTPPAA